MSLSALNHLKSELQRKKEDAEKQKRSIETHHLTPLAKLEKEEESSSDRKKLPELTGEELEKAKKARDILEAKAKLYDSLSEGVHLTKNGNLYLVNFEQKAIDDFRTRCCDSASDPDRIIDLAKKIKTDDQAKNSNEDQELKKCSDKELLLKARNLSSSDSSQNNESKPKETSEPTLISADMQREKKRQKWEEDEKLARSKDEIHYQDILYDEVRGHGVGYFAFSKDEEERRRQQAELEEIRKETLRKQEEFRKLRGDVSDDKASNESAEKEEVARELTDEEKLKNIEDALKSIRREVHVREWDKGKELPVMTQEEWLEKKRSERDSDFAPPEIYFENQGQGPKRKRPIQLLPRKGLFQKKPSSEGEKKTESAKTKDHPASGPDLSAIPLPETAPNNLSNTTNNNTPSGSEKSNLLPNPLRSEDSKLLPNPLRSGELNLLPNPLRSETLNCLPNPLRSEDSNLLPNPLRSEEFNLLHNPSQSGESNLLPNPLQSENSNSFSNPFRLESENVSADSHQDVNVKDPLKNSHSELRKISPNKTNSSQLKNPKKSAMALLEQTKDLGSNSEVVEQVSPENSHNETVTSISLPQGSNAKLVSGTAHDNPSSMTISSERLSETPSLSPIASNATKKPFFVPSNLIPRRFTSNIKPKSTFSDSSTASVIQLTTVDSSNEKPSNLFVDSKLSRYLKEPENSGTLDDAAETTTSSNLLTSAVAESSTNKGWSNPLTDPKLSRYFKEPENIGANSTKNTEPSSASTNENNTDLSSDNNSDMPSDSDGSSSNNEGSRIKLGNLIRNRPAPKSGMALLEEIKKSTRDFGPEDESKDTSRFSRKRGAEIAPPECLLHSTPQLPVRKKGLFSKKAEISDSISAGLHTLKTVADKKKKKTREKGLLDIL